MDSELKAVTSFAAMMAAMKLYDVMVLRTAT
jgi:hypothetical protein